MARATKSGKGSNLPSYIKNKVQSGEQGVAYVGAKIDVALKAKFESAVQLADKAGYSVVLSEVIRHALIQAIEDVEGLTGKLAGQKEMDLNPDAPADAPADNTDKPSKSK